MFQLMAMQSSVRMWRMTVGTWLSGLTQSRSIASSTKKYAPQRTKFQLAPCHRPVSSQTTAIFR